MTYEPQAMTLAMHIPDNFISPSTGAVFWAVMIPIWVLCFRSVVRNGTPERMAYLGAGAAFSFLIMMFNVPTPGGTTAHGVGGALIALLLGPQYATVAVSVALLLQALLFGDGGLITLGANCFNMAVVLPFAAYGIYRGVRAVVGLVAGDGRGRGVAEASGGMRGGARLDPSAGGHGDGGAAGAGAGADLADRVAIFIAGYVGLTLAALCVAVELGVQPMLFHDVAGRALYFPFPLAVTIPAMLIPYLAVAGVVEGLVTLVVVDFVRRAAPEIVTSGTSSVARAIADDGRGGASAAARDVADAAPLAASGPKDVRVTVALSADIAGDVVSGRSVSRETSQRVSWAVSRETAMRDDEPSLRPGLRRPLWIALAIVALLSPLGLIATGDAWGEWGAEDFMAATGLDYVPRYIAHGFTWDTLLPDYSLAGLPDVVGYLISAVIGIAATTIIFRLLALAVREARVRRVRGADRV